MRVLALDLAAKYSAYVLVNEDGSVVKQRSSAGESEDDFLAELVMSFGMYRPEVLACEDLPHRLPFASLVKQVCRIQGRLIEKMIDASSIDKLLFVPPALWQRSYGTDVWRQGPEAVVPAAKNLFDYDPPLDYEAFHGKERTMMKKVRTDYCAAYLIARWTLKSWQEKGTFDIPSTSRYRLD